jgi:hypothetical protein
MECLNTSDPHARWRAVEWGLKHIWHFRDDARNFGVQLATGADGKLETLNVRFQMLDKSYLDSFHRAPDEKPVLLKPEKVIELRINKPSSGVPIVQSTGRKGDSWMD